MARRTYSEIAREYDEIAHEYRDSKLLPFRDYAESFSLFRLIGKLDGRTVLDLACGEGHYTRRLKQAGAARVLGIDISPEMIKLAESEKATPLGCQYQVGECCHRIVRRTVRCRGRCLPSKLCFQQNHVAGSLPRHL
jgi:ubiquinone/menaquinone biosynthesis C-methylase UbiE